MKWDERYAEPGFAYGTAPNDFLAQNVAQIPAGGNVLSLAEGEGRNAVFLAQRGFHVTAVDSSAVGLEKARQLAAQSRVEIETIASDLAAFDLGKNRWDGIVSIWCHVPSPLRARLHQAIIAALRPSGVLLLESYTPQQLEYKTGGPPTADFLTTRAELERQLRELEFISCEEKTREVHEGKYHNGKSAVVQLVARKR